MTNPLVAAPKSSTTAVSGIPLLESALDVKTAIESGDWASAAMGIAGTALDALTTVMDPFGSILASGVGWLLEHVGPLREALDALAGDADQVQAHAQTWTNVATELGAVGEDLIAMINADTAGWTGAAGDAYRLRGADTANLIAATQQAAAGAASGVQTGGEVVAAVRTFVRDIIAELVGHLISWALQVIFTLGVGLTWVVPQVVNEVAKVANRIAGIVTKLVKALKALVPLLKRAGDIFADASSALKKLKGNSGGAGTTPKVNNFAKLGGGGKSRSLNGGGASTSSSTTPSSSGPPDEWDKIAPPKPYQHEPGGVPIPPAAHDHVILGDLKPPKSPNGSWKFSGGHVWHTDVPPGTAPTQHHGAGVTGSAAPAGPFASHPNGVYTVPKPTMTNPHGGGAVKPGKSSMFPLGLGPGSVQNVGGQAWNGGVPNGGYSQVNGKTSYTWQGQGQIPYTPVWNPNNADPNLPNHGSGDGNHTNAGHTVTVSGFANPPSGTGTGPHQLLPPPTYFPDGNNQLPPMPPPPP